MQPWVLSLPDKELCLREALAVCMENPMDGGAWWATVHGVTKSRTRLSDFHFHWAWTVLDSETQSFRVHRDAGVTDQRTVANGLVCHLGGRSRQLWSVAEVVSKAALSCYHQVELTSSSLVP